MENLRESGFYWVKMDDKWRVAEFISDEDSSFSYGNVWGVVGRTQFYCDNNFDEINETRIER